MSLPITRPLEHKEVTFEQGQLPSLMASPWFAPPVPNGMQEPGTNYVTIITSSGPHMLIKPRPGIVVGSNNAEPKQTRVPLTRTGG
jgi:hypothetical protein